MIPAELEGPERLQKARTLFEQDLDYYDQRGWFDQVQNDLDYFHGRQWMDEDLEALRADRRPALVFNVVHAKILHLIGSHEDNRLAPVVVPVGMEDQLQADLINHTLDRIGNEIQLAQTDAKAFEDGVVAGIANVAFDVEPDPDDPLQLQIGVTPLHPIEVIWDPAARCLARSDARYLFWTRWLSVSEFTVEYPDFRDRVKELIAEAEKEPTALFGDRATERIERSHRDAYKRRSRDMLYYDARRNMVRVTHMEFRRPKKIVEVVAPNGQRRAIEPSAKAGMKKLSPDLDFIEYWKEEVRWMEFVGDEILYEGENPLPVDGFSVVAYVCNQDDEGLPYGKVKHLRDPQSELNKRYSQMLHWMNMQPNPGIYAEANALADERQAETSLRRAGSITLLNAGGIGKILERKVPDLPAAPAQMAETSLKLIELISGVHADPVVEPRGIPEAAATTQLKHRQSMMAQRPIHRGFHQYQRAITKRMIQTIVRSYSDEQLERLLGNATKWQVRAGQVQDRETGQVASLETMRDLEYNVELLPAEVNNMQKAIELQLLMQLLQGGFPVDPAVLIENMPFTRDKQDRLKAFVAQSMQAQAQSGEAQTQMALAQLQREHQLEVVDRVLKAADVSEEKRHNMALELIAAQKAGIDLQTKLAQMASQAVGEEKRLATDLLKQVMQTESQLAVAKQRGNGNAQGVQAVRAQGGAQGSA